MIICPTCGAQNDPGNRFCDQCGTRLEPEAAGGTMAAPTLPASDVAPQPAPAVASDVALSCPNCGAAVIPGQAFCDECGFPLNTTVSDAIASEAPTLMVMPEYDSAPTAADDVTLIDTRHEFKPEQSATLPVPRPLEDEDSEATLMTAPAEPTSAVPVAPEQAAQPSPAAPSDLEAILTPPPEFQSSPPASKPSSKTMPDLDSILAPPLPTPQPEPQPELDPEPVAVPPGPAALPEPPAPEEASPVAVVAEEAPPEAAPATDQVERQRLEGLIAAHRETITQYEQMLTRYPEGTAPPFLVAGLDEARKALEQAETDLAGLAPPSEPSGPDPAEVARLEGLLTAHRETIAQYQQMHDRYPAGAAPAFLKAGLDEAQKALEQTEAELAALRGEAVVPVLATASAPASAPAAVPPAAAPAAAPRLVLVTDGQELRLPTGKTEIIVGREDPVSQIFPEIDLTQHGGESGGVSRQHARISQQNGQWTIVDLDSTNYTRVDGARIEPNTPTPIQDGTQIHFGRVAVVFHI